jgi:hypothetical protein
MTKDELKDLLSVIPAGVAVHLHFGIDEGAAPIPPSQPPAGQRMTVVVPPTADKKNNRVKVFDKASKGSNPVGFVFENEVVYVSGYKNGYLFVASLEHPRQDFVPGYVEGEYLV